MDDDDTPGTSVVESGYSFYWLGSALGRVGLGGSGRTVGATDAPYLTWLGSWWASFYPTASAALSGGWSDPGQFDGYRGTRYATVGYFPAAGYRDNSYSGAPIYVSAYGYVWSSSHYPVADPQYVSFLYFVTTDVVPSNSGNRGYGFAVRCVQEEVHLNSPWRRVRSEKKFHTFVLWKRSKKSA